jgi:hypothetical protein
MAISGISLLNNLDLPHHFRWIFITTLLNGSLNITGIKKLLPACDLKAVSKLL